MKRLVKVTFLVLCIMGIAASNLAAQDQFPNRTITMSQAYSAGGSTDLVARAIAAIAPKYLSQPIIVVAKPGGGGLIAVQALASAKPDGHYWHLGRMGDMVNNAYIERIPFDMDNDFIPVAQVANDDLFISCSSKTGWKTIEDLVAAVRKEPGKYKFAASGTTTSGRIVFEAWANMMGLDIPVVPFKGAAPASIAVAGGHIPIFHSTIGEALAHVQRGDIVPLMMMGDRVTKALPNVSMPKDHGWKFDMSSWHIIFVGKGTPQPIINKIESICKSIVADPDYVKACDGIGSTPVFATGKESAVLLKDHRAQFGPLIKKLGISNIK
jgi:tripartite-type tricarboxylate transporter receptor subunit TctC